MVEAWISAVFQLTNNAAVVEINGHLGVPHAVRLVDIVSIVQLYPIVVDFLERLADGAPYVRLVELTRCDKFRWVCQGRASTCAFGSAGLTGGRH